MSRDFLGSELGRSFLKSPNRDRRTRGLSSANFFGAIIHSTKEFFRPTPGVSNYEYVADFNPPWIYDAVTTPDAPVTGEIPDDIFPDFFNTPTIKGQHYRIVLDVYGISDLYHPATEPSNGSIVTEGFNSWAGVFSENQITFEWASMKFAPMVDAYVHSKYYLPREEFTTIENLDLNGEDRQNKLLLNYSEIPRQGLYYWGKRITCVCKATQEQGLLTRVFIGTSQRRGVMTVRISDVAFTQNRRRVMRKNKGTITGSPFNVDHPFYSGETLIPSKTIFSLDAETFFNPEFCNSVYGKMTSVSRHDGPVSSEYEDLFTPVRIA